MDDSQVPTATAPDSSADTEPYSMIEWPTVERTRIADGTEFVLGRYGESWVIRVGPQILMSTRMHDSEEALAEIGLARASSAGQVPRHVLVGGLGLGYTARAVLDRVPPDACVTVLELMPELVDWNRRYLGKLAGEPLLDPRCKLVLGDVFDTLKRSPNAFDVILLDVDNGPRGLSQPQNQRLYGERGIAVCLDALRPGGVLAVWSQGPSARYLRKLEKVGTEVEMLTVPGREGWSTKHVLFIAKRRD